MNIEIGKLTYYIMIKKGKFNKPNKILSLLTKTVFELMTKQKKKRLKTQKWRASELHSFYSEIKM